MVDSSIRFMVHSSIHFKVVPTKSIPLLCFIQLGSVAWVSIKNRTWAKKLDILCIEIYSHRQEVREVGFRSSWSSLAKPQWVESYQDYTLYIDGNGMVLGDLFDLTWCAVKGNMWVYSLGIAVSSNHRGIGDFPSTHSFHHFKKPAWLITFYFKRQKSAVRNLYCVFHSCCCLSTDCWAPSRVFGIVNVGPF